MARFAFALMISAIAVCTSTAPVVAGPTDGPCCGGGGGGGGGD